MGGSSSRERARVSLEEIPKRSEYVRKGRAKFEQRKDTSYRVLGLDTKDRVMGGSRSRERARVSLEEIPTRTEYVREEYVREGRAESAKHLASYGDHTQGMIQKRKKSKLQPLDGLIEITTTEPDMITLDDDPNSKRAKMPCGHVIGPASMTEYCTEVLNSGKYIFVCPDPSCNAEWQYFLVRHVACLTPSQMQEFEKRISENFMKREEEGIRRCPGCDIHCSRKEKTNNCVQCLVCSNKQGVPYMFCWKCLGTWKGGNGTTCGNTQCHGIDSRVAILANCPKKMILDKFDAPSVRGCPKCGMLIEYLYHCTQMHCKDCDHFFCFLCLEGAKTKKELKCDPYKSTCKIAPRQTQLPGM